MCGLAGGWSHSRFSDLVESLPRMTRSLVHRGPDDSGHWLDSEAGIAIGHRRLAIVDLSPAGHQPMESAGGRWVIAFNGEIYNHLLLRSDLAAAGKNPVWRGGSDTETLLAILDAYGVEVALGMIEGMFALAIWDKEQRCLWLARDRLGEKPLYFGWSNGAFLFASELRAIRAFARFDASISQAAIALFLRHSAVPAPYSIYNGIAKVLPGQWLRVSERSLAAGREPESGFYWTAADSAAKGETEPYSHGENQALIDLEQLISDAVRRQMMADVPLGAFLSGGVDSSLVVALMQAQSTRPVKTFSIGFHEKTHDEAPYAAAVARHLGTDHTELYVTSEDALSVVPDLPNTYDEPFADSSQIPTCLVARLARKHVTVALSGDGGDELFGGYSRYPLSERLWSRIERIPSPLRAFAARSIAAVPVAAWDSLYRAASPLIPRKNRWAAPGDKIAKGAHLLGCGTGPQLYREMISHWSPSALLPNIAEPISYGVPRRHGSASLIEYMMLEDSCHYLPDDILVKVDRAAMACSLETRVPLLDSRVFEFAWRLPMSLRRKNGIAKYPLKAILARHVPPSLTERPKMGFGIPLDEWLRGPLKDWASSLLDSARLRQEGNFDPEPISKKWVEHQAGTRNWQYHIWDILMFQAWLERTTGSQDV